MQTRKSKKLLVLGGRTLGSVDMVRYAAEIGVHSIVADYLPVSASPAKQEADENWNVSTADIDGIVRRATEAQVQAVIAGADEFNLRAALAVSKRLELPFFLEDIVWERTGLKHRFKASCRRFGIPVPAEYGFARCDLESSHVTDYPVLLKPVDGSSGEGIILCNNANELSAACSTVQTDMQDRTFMVEGYLDGEEFTVFYVLQGGEIYMSAMADRHMRQVRDGKIPLPVAYTFPSGILDIYRDKLDARVVAMFAALGMREGMAFLQGIVTGDGIFVYEMGYRLTGTLEYKFIKHQCGFSPLEMLVDYGLTGSVGSLALKSLANPAFKTPCCNLTYLCNPGKIGGIIGVDAVKTASGVLDVVLSYSAGEEIPDSALGTLKQVVARVFVVAPNWDSMKARIRQINTLFNVVDAQGNSLLLEPFELDEANIRS